MKKFLILTLLFVAFVLPVSAEQPAAEQYRQMFASGNFYVECRIIRSDVKSANMVFAGQNGNRMYRATSAGTFTTNYSKYMFDSLNAALSKIYSSHKSEVSHFETFKEKKWPDVMYRDGKYYRFSTSGLAMRGVGAWVGSSKKVKALVLPEEKLTSPDLNPNEGWNLVREDLALPDELAIFCWNEPFRDNVISAPRYNGSSKREIDGKEYDCDQYIVDIKNLAGTVAAQEVFNALYDGGNLVRVQKYLIRDGKENFIHELLINNLSAQVPDSAFAIGKKIEVYAAEKGDMKDLLEQPELVETLGGN